MIKRIPENTAKPAGINVLGPLGSDSGLAEHARRYLKAIQHAGIRTALKDIDFSRLWGKPLKKCLSTLEQDCPFSINLLCFAPKEHFYLKRKLGERFWTSRYNICHLAWEVPGIPGQWHELLSDYDEIWVGTSFIANALAPVSPTPVIRIPPVMAVAIDGSRDAGRRRLGLASDEFCFLFIFNWISHSQRKNPFGLIDAFKTAFGPSEPVRLVIKCLDVTSEAVEQMESRAESRRISIYSDRWPAAEMNDLMAACDAYVSLHRAEGTGLTISDAMAYGKPVIATWWSGNTDYMSPFNSFPVRYDLVALGRDLGPYKAGDIWAEPSMENAAEQMRLVFDNRKEAQQRGRSARRDMEKYFSEAPIGFLIQNRLNVIQGIREYPADFVNYKSYQEIIRSVQEAVNRSTPPGSIIAVINKGDDEMLDFDEREGWHFPRAQNGSYGGGYPADSAAAADHLAELHLNGAGYLAIPSTSFWWLDHYAGFRDRLEKCHENVFTDAMCKIYKLLGRT
jgi:glycosyltransferase involved in cell wall biosynthesis